MQASAHSRPLGPRSIARSSPPPVTLSDTAPLIIRKTPKLGPSLSPPANSTSRSPTPSLGLQIPTSRSRPSTPKPTLRLGIPSQSNGSASNGAESPLITSYYGGPPGLAPNSSTSEQQDERTIVPLSTCLPTQRRHAEPLADIRELLSELEIRTTSSLPNPDAEDDALPNLISAYISYTDNDLEEISRLGEGAGGAVHKVKDKRTGQIMARKTITTREAPMKQLLRELSIISSTQHVNIILFHGAYISPSSSEVKILME